MLHQLTSSPHSPCSELCGLLRSGGMVISDTSNLLTWQNDRGSIVAVQIVPFNSQLSKIDQIRIQPSDVFPLLPLPLNGHDFLAPISPHTVLRSQFRKSDPFKWCYSDSSPSSSYKRCDALHSHFPFVQEVGSGHHRPGNALALELATLTLAQLLQIDHSQAISSLTSVDTSWQDHCGWRTQEVQRVEFIEPSESWERCRVIVVVPNRLQYHHSTVESVACVRKHQQIPQIMYCDQYT